MKLLKANFVTLFIILLSVGCKKTKPDTDIPVDLTQARLNSFELAEVSYLNITINHPGLRNGAEDRHGEIRIKIPKGNTQLKLTPKASNFSNDQFIITPQLGTLQNFSNGKITYTITSRVNTNKKVHYDVTIEEEDEPANTLTQITAFRFEKSRNPELAADIEADKIIYSDGNFGRIYVFVPVGTDFSKLTPTITYNGAGLFYTQDANSIPANSTTTYPSSGMMIDFAYPKVFYAIIKSNSEVKIYDVIVDVRNPIKFSHSSITTADVQKGAVRFIQQATSFTNQGNHPISLEAVNHINHIPAGSNAIRANGVIPNFGLKPNESAVVTATISAQTFPPGTYQTTAVFTPEIYQQPDADGLLEASQITIKTTITD